LPSAILFFNPRPSSDRESETGLWTNSTAIINVLTLLHEKLWGDAADVTERLTHRPS